MNFNVLNINISNAIDIHVKGKEQLNPLLHVPVFKYQYLVPVDNSKFLFLSLNCKIKRFVFMK